MTKRLGVSPKIVETGVSVQAEAKGKLWDAVPMHAGENLKAWFPRVARVLTSVARTAGYDVRWTPRRVRALWNEEARRIDHIEMKIIEIQESAAKRRETLNGYAIGIATHKAALRDDAGGTAD